MYNLVAKNMYIPNPLELKIDPQLFKKIFQFYSRHYSIGFPSDFNKLFKFINLTIQFRPVENQHALCKVNLAFWSVNLNIWSTHLNIWSQLFVSVQLIRLTCS